MKKIVVIFVLFVLSFSAYADDTLRLVHYNLMQYSSMYGNCTSSNNSLSRKDSCLRTIFSYLSPDIITVNEVGKTLYYSQRILDSCLNINGVEKWAKGTLTAYSGSADNTLSNMIFYNCEKLTMHSSSYVENDVRDFNIYRLYYNKTHLNSGDTAFLVVIIAHLKAGQSDSITRFNQVETLVNRLNAIGVADNYIFCGDLNFYTSAEPAFKLLTQNSNAAIRFYDPMSMPGKWHENGAYAYCHTQSTRNEYGNCFSSGGLDDRFDFILFSESVLKGYDKVKALTNTYRALGQDGNHFNKSLLSPSNNSAPQNVLNALYNMSDHLPVTMDFVVTGVNNVKLSAVETMNIKIVNPIESKLYFSIADQKKYTYKIEVLSIFGQVLFSTTIYTNVGRNDFQFEIPKLTPGIYCLRVSADGVQTVRKIIKK